MTRQAKAQEKRARRAVRRCLASSRNHDDLVWRGLSLVWPWLMAPTWPPGAAACTVLSAALGTILGATRPAIGTPSKPEPRPHTLNPRSAVALSVILAGASMGRR